MKRGTIVMDIAATLEPVIADRLPILEAAKANEIRERGGVRGKIVLLAPERM